MGLFVGVFRWEMGQVWVWSWVQGAVLSAQPLLCCRFSVVCRLCSSGIFILKDLIPTLTASIPTPDWEFILLCMVDWVIDECPCHLTVCLENLKSFCDAACPSSPSVCNRRETVLYPLRLICCLFASLSCLWALCSDEAVFSAGGFGYLSKTGQHRRGMAQREGSELGSLVSCKSWSLVDLNYWKLVFIAI